MGFGGQGDSKYPRYAYFLGIGGIGMSCIARYLKGLGIEVAGYDLTRTPLTDHLEAEGIGVNYDAAVSAIPEPFQVADPERTLVVYTPAVPSDLPQMVYFREQGFSLHKRAEVLGWISNARQGIAVAGTHGKTTTTTMVSHILSETVGCLGFLGGISVNYSSNLVDTRRDYAVSKAEELCVVEADEYDRSFLQLKPRVGVITSMSPDHLDVYGDYEGMVQAYREFASHAEGGTLVLQQGIAERFNDLSPRRITYGLYSGEGPRPDYAAWGLRVNGAGSSFMFQKGNGQPVEVQLGIPGRYNVENALGALAAVESAGVPLERAIPSLATFRGVERRFQIRFQDAHRVLVDDYAHHPDELRATVETAHALYPEKRIVGIFQPHLYSRTRDLAEDFARALSGVDELLLLPIYPAREQPIPGVTSELILSYLPGGSLAKVVAPNDIAADLVSRPEGVFLVMGAGNISALVPGVERALRGA